MSKKGKQSCKGFKSALKRATAKGLLIVVAIAVIGGVSFGIYAGVESNGNKVSPADIKGATVENYEVIDTLPNNQYEQEPSEKLPDPTEDEKEILEENKNHNNGSSVEMER